MSKTISVFFETPHQMELFILLFGLGLATAEYSLDYGHIEAFLKERKSAQKTKNGPLFHISSPVGWLRDPAAFIYFKNQYHIFYEYHPNNGAWGAVNWGHVVSSNLVDWAHYPPALVPKDYYEKQGCLAGSAIIHDRYLTLFYTGYALRNSKSWQTQNVAISTDGIIFQKYLYNPVIREDLHGVGNFRNPKVWRHRNNTYMMLGTTSREQLGRLELYTSVDMNVWTFNKTLAESYGDMGFMWENPDMIDMDGMDVLILSVQGIQADCFRFKNMYQSGYIVGHFEYEKLAFENMELSTATFNELDHGHDFYGVKTTIGPDGRRLLIAGLGMSSLAESRHGWANMLTLVREIQLNKKGEILMTPVREVKQLRREILERAWYSPGGAFTSDTKYFELILNTTTATRDVSITFEWGDGSQFKVGYSSEHRYVTVDRGREDGVRRADWSPKGIVYWRIFMDYCAVEVYCGNGEVVFTSRIPLPRGRVVVKVGGETMVHITQYKLRRGVGYSRISSKKMKYEYRKKVEKKAKTKANKVALEDA
ncbi:sucrose-6-phosphate hydrolase-like [Cydia fagiglandana]|uniref:sucrose-6-phosphate hydrolase-like n=1 Tax=Cydia fagiglandana TaxID=1458189 RepID=UPI002FEE176C